MIRLCKPVKNIDAALKAYYTMSYLDNKTIGVIFDTKADSTIAKLKKPVKDEESKRNMPVVVPRHINTKVAFEVWGIDINELEKNKMKLTKLGLV